MFKNKLNKNHLLYKPYLYYNLFFHHKCFIKKNSYSQSGEDDYINSYFKNTRDGFYIDIGCFHPILHSNTARLYDRGWKGINIDINQTSIDLFNIIRKRDKNFCIAISNENKKIEYYKDNNFSPINSINKKFFKYTLNKFSDGKFIQKEIYSYKLLDFLNTKNIKTENIDFLNIDAESHDYEVLQGIDFKKINIKLICVEMFDENSKINELKFTNFLKDYGYLHIKNIGANGFFEKK
tara:strand:- start:150 stop:860 length:711 start_codon:yes stop_codon:yes gene_type:complete